MTESDRSKGLLIVGGMQWGKSLLREALIRFYAETGRTVTVIDQDDALVGYAPAEILLDDRLPELSGLNELLAKSRKVKVEPYTLFTPNNRKARRAAKSRRNK